MSLTSKACANSMKPTPQPMQSARTSNKLMERSPDSILLTELYRELGRFDEAKSALQACTEDDVGVTSKLLAKMIDDRTNAPVRSRM